MQRPSRATSSPVGGCSHPVAPMPASLGRQTGRVLPANGARPATVRTHLVNICRSKSSSTGSPAEQGSCWGVRLGLDTAAQRGRGEQPVEAGGCVFNRRSVSHCKGRSCGAARRCPASGWLGSAMRPARVLHFPLPLSEAREVSARGRLGTQQWTRGAAALGGN